MLLLNYLVYVVVVGGTISTANVWPNDTNHGMVGIMLSHYYKLSYAPLSLSLTEKLYSFSI